MKLEHTFRVAAPVDRVWRFLLDVPVMAACIPGAAGVTEIDETTYDATVAAKIGPISARFGCRIVILSMDEAELTGRVEVSGRDSKLGSSVKAQMSMTMREEDGSTTVEITTEADVMGKIGQYGHGMISKRADAMIADFAVCAQARLSEEG